MILIGIDPAPSKPSTVYDGKNFGDMTPVALSGFLQKQKDVFVAWDAPLTITEGMGENNRHPVYQREIEYVSKKRGGKNLPSGISVLGAAGCPHWAVSQFCLGFPNPYSPHTCLLPEGKNAFQLVTGQDHQRPEKGRYVTEVHPARAMLDLLPDRTAWDYKKGTAGSRGILTRKIADELVDRGFLAPGDLTTIFQKTASGAADRLDAAVAFRLLYHWYHKTAQDIDFFVREGASWLTRVA